MSFDVSNRVALVTGANRGIGLAITRALLANHATKVYTAVRDVDSVSGLKQEFGERVAAVHLDLQQADSVKQAAQQADDVELVVNNAGVLRTESPLSPQAFEALQWELDVNVYGLLRIAQAFAPTLKKNGGGALVQLNSVASLRSRPAFATYAASKAAAYSLTQALRVQLGEQGTQVLSVHPGPIDTDMAAQAGLEDTDPPSVVADGILVALRAGQFHLFPDRLAEQMGAAYASFAANVVEASD